MMNKEIIIALCAGEASGDLLGAHLIDALKKQYPNSRFIGIGGPRMKAAGLISLYEQDPLAVRGYVEILGNLTEILSIRRGLVEDLKKVSPHVFVGIDSPNFNLPVAEKLKAAGIPTLHYVSPSVWAWKPERVHKIIKQVNKVLCLFPMEPKLYREAGGQAEYVGHPLAQMLPIENSREATRERLKLNLTTPVFALLPGSRVSEIEFMAPIFLRAAALITQALPESVFLLPYPTAMVRERLQQYLQQEEFRHLPIRLQAAKTELACMAADVVLVTSGTAALEVALCKRPMVISYKIAKLTYALVRRKIKIPHVGLPNILLGKEVVPELLQNNATPENLANAVLDWYYHPARVVELEQQFTELHHRLQRNTDELAAYAVLTEAGLNMPKPIATGSDEDVVLSSSSEPTAEASPTVAETPALPETVEVAKSTQQPEAVQAAETPKQPETVEVAESTQQPETVQAAETPKQPETVEVEIMPTTEQPAAVVAVETIQPEPSTTPNSSEPDMNPSQPEPEEKPASGGLFGWLKSLFGGKPETQTEAEPTPYSVVVNDASIVAVSRATENDETETTEPVVQAAEKAPEASTQTAVVASVHINEEKTEDKTETPAVVVAESSTRIVLEQEELPVAPNPIGLPKSSILTAKKPHIFSKYMQQNANAAATAAETPADSTPEVTSEPETLAKPHIQVTAVVRKTEDVAKTNENQAYPKGILAEYITKASMAGLSIKHKPTPIAEETNHTETSTNISKSEPVISVDTAPKITPSITVQAAMPTVDEHVPETVESAPQLVVPTITITKTAPAVVVKVQKAPAETHTQMSVSVVKTTPEVAEQPAAEVAPAITVAENAPEVAEQPAAEIAPAITVAENAPEVAEQPAAEVAAPAITVAEVEQAATLPESTPATTESLPPAPNMSFASVFRRNQQNIVSESVDDSTEEVLESSNQPDSIVVERTMSMPHNSTPEVKEESPLPAPSVSSYSSNPKRYNNGIYF